MTAPQIGRRAVLGSGAAAAGWLAAGAPALPHAAAATVGKPLMGWLTIAGDGSGRIRLVETNERSAPSREVLAQAIPSGPLADVARRANAIAVSFAAAHWGVPRAECATGRGCIEHRASGRSVPFAIWTDFA